ncbi:MAG: DUF6789 family protein [Chloroflexota bacterium]
MENRTTESMWESLNVVGVFLHGAIGGILGGVAFALAQVVAAVLAGQPSWQPLQLIASILMGDRVLMESDFTGQVLLAALLVHMVLSVTYGIILMLLAVAGFAVLAPGKSMALVGMVFGLILWFINFYVIAPAAFPWFDRASTVVQLICHVVFYGGVLGAYIGVRLRQQETKHIA